MPTNPAIAFSRVGLGIGNAGTDSSSGGSGTNACQSEVVEQLADEVEVFGTQPSSRALALEDPRLPQAWGGAFFCRLSQAASRRRAVAVELEKLIWQFIAQNYDIQWAGLAEDEKKGWTKRIEREEERMRYWRRARGSSVSQDVGEARAGGDGPDNEHGAARPPTPRLQCAEATSATVKREIRSELFIFNIRGSLVKMSSFKIEQLNLHAIVLSNGFPSAKRPQG
jgi:hypothetical protein